MNTTAIIVTYNRLTLLKECIKAVLSQSIKPNRVIVIDNASNDGTDEYLKSLGDSICTYTLEKNIGGAGGFSAGIKLSCENKDCDAVWIMDDDTIPTKNCLEELLKAYQDNPNLGYVCSKVIWKDNSIHRMNIPGFVSEKDVDSEVRQIRSASFVSLLIPKRIILEVGLPYKEFFIWADDSEFTSRIYKRGYQAQLINRSVALHNTAYNYGASIENAPVETAWKFYYLMRNNMFACRDEFPYIVWFFKQLNHLRLNLHRLKRMPKENREVFRVQLWKGFKDGLTFSPKVEYLV